MSTRDHRGFHRFPVQIPVSVSTLDVFLDSHVMNISKGGIFIRSDLCLRLGQEIELTFTIPDRKNPIRALGTVVWTRSRNSHSSFAPNHPTGMGVEFSDIRREDLNVLMDSIESILEKD